MNNTVTILKEIVSAVLALALVGTAIWLMVESFSLDPKMTADEFQRRSGVLQIAVGLAGTAVGYYFGRVPAEKSADAARQSESEARKELVDANRTVSDKAATAAEASTRNALAKQEITGLQEQLTATPLGGAGKSDNEVISDRLDSIRRALS